MNPEAIIEDFKARKVFDSRGSETIEVDITTKGGFGRFSAPSGASTGKWEVQAYPQEGIDASVRILNRQLGSELIGMSSEDQDGVDSLLHRIDGTENFGRIGGNIALAISVASALAAASSKNMPLFHHLSGVFEGELPHPLGNVIGGGMHAKGDRTDIQEFLILPLRAKTFAEAALANVAVHHELIKIFQKKRVKLGGKGDEGAWVVDLETIKALETLNDACRKIEKELNVEIGMGMDVAASSLWNNEDECYIYRKEEKKLESGDQVEFILTLIEEYGLVYVEDPVHEDDFESFAELTRKADNALICGDDLFTTNVERLELGLKHHAGNAIIIKPNQVGTLSDTYETVKKAESHGYTTITSHRSGETCDPLIAHLAIALKSPIIKSGVMGGERVAKINELMRIEEMLGEKSKLAEIRL